MAAPFARPGLLSDECGTMAVEFALVAPVLVTLLLGVADYGMAAVELSKLRAAARAGIQAVLLSPTDTAGAKDIAETMAPEAVVTLTCHRPDGTSQDCTDAAAPPDVREVELEVSRDLTLLVPWPGMDDPLPLSGVARMRVQ